MQLFSESLNGGAPGEAPGEQIDGIGCTANVVMIDKEKEKIFISNAGDSRAVLCRGGQAIALSYDHKPDNEEERKRIESAGSFVAEGRVDGNLNLSRSLGDLKYKRRKHLDPQSQSITAWPDVKEIDLELEKDEFIIMGCDGIWETKSNDEMVEFVTEKINKYKKDGKVDTNAIVSEMLNEIISPDYT